MAMSRKEIQARYYEKHREKILERNRNSKSRQETYKKCCKAWREKNPDKNAAKEARRRAAKLNRTPNWLTDEQKKEIDSFYQLARDCTLCTGEPYHVDHIVPLQGELVSGLHVPWNLQVLPADINLTKGNKH